MSRCFNGARLTDGPRKEEEGLVRAAGESLVKRELSNERRFRDLMRCIVPYMMRRSSLISFNTPQPTAGARNGMERNTTGIRGASDSSRRPFQFLAAAMCQGVFGGAKKRRGAASLLVRDSGQRRRNVHFGHRRFCALYMAVEYSGVTIDGIDAAVSAVACFSISFPSYC